MTLIWWLLVSQVPPKFLCGNHIITLVLPTTQREKVQEHNLCEWLLSSDIGNLSKLWDSWVVLLWAVASKEVFFELSAELGKFHKVCDNIFIFLSLPNIFISEGAILLCCLSPPVSLGSTEL